MVIMTGEVAPKRDMVESTVVVHVVMQSTSAKVQHTFTRACSVAIEFASDLRGHFFDNDNLCCSSGEFF